MPDHVVALALLEAFERSGGKGVAAPSANRFGHVSPTTAAAVIEELGEYFSEDDLVLDGGVCEVGVESTIIDCTGTTPSVLRPGAISVTMIEKCTGLKTVMSNSKIRASGSLKHHYMPTARVILDQTPAKGSGLLALASIQTPPGVVRLASPHNNSEFAAILYQAFRLADKLNLTEVFVFRPSNEGIGIAINDRLSRSSVSGNLNLF